ncbi:hypothetical protein ACN6LJ_001045 [Streptomyces drozdowiczii]
MDRTADYGAFPDAARGRVDLVRIERHWEDIGPENVTARDEPRSPR